MWGGGAGGGEVAVREDKGQNIPDRRDGVYKDGKAKIGMKRQKLKVLFSQCGPL